MRAFVAAAVAANLLATACGPAFAFDPSTGLRPQRFSDPAAVAYFRLPFGAAKADDKMAYGFAVTAPVPYSYGAAPVPIADAPKLVDLRFNGAVPESLRVTGQVAWTLDPSRMPDGPRLNLLGGLGGLALGLAGTALAVYGVYRLVKKKCPAVSTSNGDCVKPAS